MVLRCMMIALVAGAALFCIISCSNSDDAINQAADPAAEWIEPVPLAVHIASDEQSAVYTTVVGGVRGTSMFIDPRPVVTGKNIVSAHRTLAEDGRPAILLELDESGAKAMLDASGQYVGRWHAVLFGDKLIYCPRAMSPLSSRLIIVGCSEWLSEAEFEELLQAILATSGRPAVGATGK